MVGLVLLHIVIKWLLFIFTENRSSGQASEIEEVEDETNRSDLGNSDNEDNNSVISQTMTSLSKKDGDQTLKEKTSFSDIGVISVCNNSTTVGISDIRTDVGLRNNNDSTNRNLESMRNSLIDVEQRLKAQR